MNPGPHADRQRRPLPGAPTAAGPRAGRPRPAARGRRVHPGLGRRRPGTLRAASLVRPECTASACRSQPNRSMHTLLALLILVDSWSASATVPRLLGARAARLPDGGCAGRCPLVPRRGPVQLRGPRQRVGVPGVERRRRRPAAAGRDGHGRYGVRRHRGRRPGHAGEPHLVEARPVQRKRIRHQRARSGRRATSTAGPSWDFRRSAGCGWAPSCSARARSMPISTCFAASWLACPRIRPSASPCTSSAGPARRTSSRWAPVIEARRR